MVAATIIERYRGPDLATEIAVVTATDGLTYTTDMVAPKFVWASWNEDVATTATMSFAISGRTITIHFNGPNTGANKKIALQIKGVR